MKKRVAWIDIARAIGIFFIVLGHIPEDGLVRKYIFSFHVPFFFLLSGICFNGHKDFKRFVEKKVKTIVVPYFVFSIMSIMIFAIAGHIIPSITKGINTDILFNIRVMLYGNSKPSLMKYNLPLWFLPCLFSTSVIVYGVERLPQKVQYKNIFRGLCIAILILVGGFYTKYMSHIYLPWHIETAIQMAVFYLLGVQVQENGILNYSKQEGNTPSVVSVLLTSAFLLMGIYGSQLNHIVGVRNDSYGNSLLYYAVSLCNCFVWIRIAIFIKHNKVLEYVGKNTLSILVLHKFPIMLVTTVLGSSRFVTIDNLISFIAACMIAIITVGLCLIGNFVISDCCPVIIGKQPKGRKRIRHENKNS